ncbi:hypothetical protein F5884DRAFT_800316 [Xylogone sp. PMI_703]|nr:hypothetical protein F5884DRAFT_800316 [Xylogone sp. PMI_703]
MAPINYNITFQFRQLIYYHLDNSLLKNALFFAERLAAYDHYTPDSSYLLSLCHLRLGDHRSAYEYSKRCGSRGAHLGCAYVFALACLELERWKDGFVALEKSRGLWGGKTNFGRHGQTSRQPYPDAAAVECLLGKLYYGYDDKKKAISHFEEALKLNPLMWDAFTSLCDMGAHVMVPNIFKMGPELEAVLRTNMQEQPDIGIQLKDGSILAQTDHGQNRPGSRPPSTIIEIPDPFNNVPARSTGGLFGNLSLSQKLNESTRGPANLPAAGGGGIGPEVLETPTGPSATIDVTLVPNRKDTNGISAYQIEPPQAPIRRNRTLQGLGMDLSIDAPKMTRTMSKRVLRAPDPSEDSAATQALRNANLAPVAGERKRTVSGQVVQPKPALEEPGAPQRRSVRLYNQIKPSASRSTASVAPTVGAPPRELKKARPTISRIMRPGSSASTVGRVVSGNRKPVEDIMEVDHKEQPASKSFPPANGVSQKSVEAESIRQEEALRWILDLCKKIGSAYFALAQYQCQEALQIYGSLPRSQVDTPWIMAQMGRAHYEQAAYADAETFYRRIRLMAPTRFEDMEIYSNVLWHLKRETDLAFLAHELIEASWESPQAWCVLGNSWSLARDHEQALRCFKRATQLNKSFAYAFTLQGHEHVANEEYDKALASYRLGISADKRHYNAYYGVGRVYEKLGNFEKAYSHFQAASTINPTNAVLICCIGTVLEKQKQPRQALAYYCKATEIAPRSTLTRFKKARTLMSIGEFEEALNELMVLKDLAPDEAMVHFLLGRLYKCLRDKTSAVRHFTIALNLDPKASHKIKEAIESLDDGDDDEDETSMMA